MNPKTLTFFSLVLISLTLLNSCGMAGPLDFILRSKEYSRQFDSTDKRLKPYVQAFEREAALVLDRPNFKVGDIPVNFGDTENSDFVGVCFTYHDGSREVIIRKRWWDHADEKARQAIVFHELGHCRLDRGHNDQVIMQDDREIRLSLMHSRMVYLNDYQQMEEEYHHELFTKQQEALLERLSR